MLPLHILSQLAANVHPALVTLQAQAAGVTHAASVPNPVPASPGPGGSAITTLLSWVKWLALAACAASAVAAGGMIAAGSVTRRAELAERGKMSLLWSVVGAVVVAIGIPLVNHAFRLG
jgi:hypothetical protein